MIIHKLIALLALLSSLTGCAGADALSPAGESSAVPYGEPGPPVIAEADTVPGDSGSTDDADSIFPTEASVRSGASDTVGSASDTVGGASDTKSGASDTKGGASDTEDGSPVTVEGASGPEAAASNAQERAGGTASAEIPAADSVTADTTALYTPFSPYSGDTLQPRDDYGQLLPYVGGTAKNGLALWGLATDDGQVVTDPAYASIKPFGPFFLLYEAVKEGGDEEAELTLCGKDGSWTMDAGNLHHCILLDGVGMAAALEDGSVIILAADGTITHTFSRAQLEKYLGKGYSWDDDDCREVVYAGGPVAICHWDDNSPYGNGAAYDCFLDPVTGDITGEPPTGFAPENGFGDPEEEPAFPGYQYPDRMEDISTGTVYYWGERDDGSDLLDSRGNVLMADFFTPGPGLWEPVVGAGMVGTIQDGAFQFARIPSGEVVFRYPLRG